MARRSLALGALVLCAVACRSPPRAAAGAQEPRQFEQVVLPTGQTLTPTAASGALFQPLNPNLAGLPGFTAGQAVTLALSPKGQTLAILTSGYNRNFDAAGKPVAALSNEYVFLYDLAGPAPRQLQTLSVPNTYVGLAFAPDRRHLYVGGGGDDDVHVFARSGEAWTEESAPIGLGHGPCGNGLLVPDAGALCKGLQGSGTAGLAVTADGARLVVANFASDSISIVELASGRILGELDLRPGKISPARRGVAGGEYPFGVAIRGSDTAYVSSLRDREVVVVGLVPTVWVVARIPVRGNPNKLILNRDQSRLFAACDNSDEVAVIDTRTNAVAEFLSTSAPPGTFASGGDLPGSSPNSLALSPDEQTLYATNGGTNSLAVISLASGAPHQVRGLIPTGWSPQGVAVGPDGRIYVVNGKSVPGPNPGHCKPGTAPRCQSDAYVLQLEKAGFLTLPPPSPGELAELTRVVVGNDHLGAPPDPADAELFAELRRRIHHVIYVIKENRTYDQVLGDLPIGNGDPSLTEYPRATTPNLHALATGFVTLDDFYATGEVSMNGWPWSTSARELDLGVKTTPVFYAKRGFSYDTEGQNRGVDVGIADSAARSRANPALNPDPDLLPGTGNASAPDARGAPQRGYVWDAALRAGLTVRSYGVFTDLTRYVPKTRIFIPTFRDPFVDGGVVAFTSNPTLGPVTDPYFRGFDNAFPDFYREREWEREFRGYVDAGVLPGLELVRLMHDHTGSFDTAIDGVNTPELQQADNDYAVGKLVEAVAHSPFAASTLVVIVEDDAQEGPDHVDAHRTIAFFAGPYLKHGQLVSRRFSTVNLVRTIEDVLGLEHLNLNDAYQRPMTEVFDLKQESWTFAAVPSALLSRTALPLGLAKEPPNRPRGEQGSPHSARYWAEAMKDFDFSSEDRLDAPRYNAILWKGLMGAAPYPTVRSGVDLREGRERLLRTQRESAGQ